MSSRLSLDGNLSGADLEESSLSRMQFDGASLRGANVARANLEGASLKGADLHGANLEGAILDGCELEGANLSNANLWCASMAGVKGLRTADVEETNVYGVEGLSAEDRNFLASQNVINLHDYPSFFAHYRSKGLSSAQIADLFPWVARGSYSDLQYLT